MKILAFTDLHGDMPSFRELKKKVSFADIIICAGDMTFFETDFEKIMKRIASLKKPIYILHGNHEVPTHVKEACKKYSNMFFLHKRVYKFGGLSLFGYGGGGFAERDQEFEEWMEKKKEHLQDMNILITHGPPYGTVADYKNEYEGNVGNWSYKKYLKHFNVAISGHIHETFGASEYLKNKKNTFVINPGPSGTILEIENGRRPKKGKN